MGLLKFNLFGLQMISFAELGYLVGFVEVILFCLFVRKVSQNLYPGSCVLVYIQEQETKALTFIFFRSSGNRYSLLDFR